MKVLSYFLQYEQLKQKCLNGLPSTLCYIRLFVCQLRLNGWTDFYKILQTVSDIIGDFYRQF